MILKISDFINAEMRNIALTVDLRTTITIRKVLCFFIVTSLSMHFMWADNTEGRVQNPGFENATDGIVAQWVLLGAKQEDSPITLDSNNKHSGTYAVKISHRDSSSYSTIAQKIQVEPDTEYTVSFWVKGSDIIPGKGGMGARLLIGKTDGRGIKPSDACTGNFPWKKGSMTFNSGSEKVVTLLLYLHLSTGDVWYDDVEIKKGAPGILQSSENKKSTMIAEQENLVRNPGIEQIPGDPLADWIMSPAKSEVSATTVDFSEYHSGKSSGKISHGNADSFSFFKQNILVEPETDYTVTFWVKGSDIVPGKGGMGVRLLIGKTDGRGIKPSDACTGTFAWKKVSMTFNSGSEGTVILQLYLHLSTGDVWFDDVEMKKGTSAAPQTPENKKSTMNVSQDNLVRNPGIEQIPGDPLADWVMSPAKSEVSATTVDFSEYHAGKSSGRISHVNADSFSFFKQNILVEPETDYTVTFWIKGANIVPGKGGVGARLIIVKTDGRGIKPSDTCTGTFSWKKVTMTFNSGSESTVALQLYLHLSTGDVWFDDIEVTKGLIKTTRIENDLQVSYTNCLTFENEAVQMLPRSMKTDAKYYSGRVIAYDNYDYTDDQGETKVIGDKCLKLDGGSAGSKTSLAATKDFPAMPSGIVEFDLLILRHGTIAISLCDNSGTELASLIVNGNGELFSEGASGLNPLLNTIEYRRRYLPTKFSLVAGRWYTLRMHFDSQSGIVRNYAILDLYKEAVGSHGYALGDVQQGDYVSLGGGTEYKTKNPATGLHFAIEKNCSVLIDNIIIFGPIGTESVNGRKIQFSARNLLNLNFVPRRDPFRLKEWSLRNLKVYNNNFMSPKAAKYLDGDGEPEFYRAGTEYNETTVRAAFIGERLNMLSRSLFYMKSGGYSGAELEKAIREISSQSTIVEKCQEIAYQAFASAYINTSSKKTLNEKHKPAARTFVAEVAKTEILLDRALSLIPVDAIVRKEVIACPGPLPKNPPQWNPERRMWEYGNQEGFYFHTTVRNPEFAKPLGFWPYSLDNFSLSFYGKYEIEDGKFIDQKYVNEKIDEVKNNQKRHAYEKQFSVIPFLQTGCHWCMQSAPNWWYANNSSDQDIYFCRNDGSAFPKRLEWVYKGTKAVQLNFWNEKVQRLQKDHFVAVGRELLKLSDVLSYPFVLFGGEAYLELQDGQEPGHNPSAIRAFQTMLMQKYGDIKTMNVAWNMAYQSFESVVPPMTRGKPNPLQYEFQKYKCRVYVEKFLVPCIQSLSNGYGSKLTTAFNHKNTFGALLDIPRLTETFDLQLHHTYEKWDKRIYQRWANNLAEASKKGWGSQEWAITQGLDVMFELDRMKLHGIRECFMQTIWGGATPNIFMAMAWNGPQNYQYTVTLSDVRLGYLVYHYHAPFVRVLIDRSQRFGVPALTYPTVTPDIVLIESEASFYNAYPANVTRELMKNIAIRLEKDGWHYGTYYEKWLLEKKQSLEGVQTVVIPNGVCMSKEMNSILESWIRKGGTILAYTPVGVYNELGLPAENSLVQCAFPKGKWKMVSDQWNLADETPIFKNGNLNLYRANVEKGTMYVFSSATSWQQAESKTIDILTTGTHRKVGTPEHSLELCLRESANAYYLYVLNWSLTNHAESEVYFSGPCVTISDEGLQRSMKVPFVRKDNVNTFRVSLEPAESTVFKIMKK